jgi:TRAP transporter TAXI family solute receptor
MIRRRPLLSFLTAAAIAPPARAQSTVLRLGTTPDGGGFAPYSVALVETLRSIDPGLEIRPVATNGSTDNAEKLQAGGIDIGLVSAEVRHERIASLPARSRRLPVVSVIYSTPGMFAVLGSSPFHQIADLRGRRVVWSPRGTGSAVQARYVMEGMRLDPDRDFEAVYPQQFSDGPTLVLEGRAAALWGSGLRLPGFVQIADHPLGARFLAPNAAEIALIRARYPFLVPLTVPSATYPGQLHDIASIGSWSFILARPDLDEAAGHRLAAALDKAEHLGLKSKYMAQTTARNTLVAIASADELQPGVLRFYREARLVE